MPPRLALAAQLDPTADRVLGQPDLTHGDNNNGNLGPASLWEPGDVVSDRAGNLYVADTSNHRVLVYHAPLSTHQAASVVLGQPDFTHNDANNGNPSASSLFNPIAVALDAAGNLFVADAGNNRVLEFDAPLSTHQAASRVFGQPDFTSGAGNNGGIGPNTLVGPLGVAVDAHGDLYVADGSNNRVLEYNAPLSTHQAANHVFGQPDFTHNDPNNGGLSADSLSLPHGLALDQHDNLYIADNGPSRVLEYDAPLTHDTTADHVFGQPDFMSGAQNNGGISDHSLSFPVGVALDAQDDLYVGDAGNNRVLEFDAPLTHGATADQVFGQADFTHNLSNNGGTISAQTLNNPAGVAVDAQGNLYVADNFNNRVLEYDLPVPHGVPALSALSPSTVAAGSPAFTLTVTGSGFVPGSVVRWNGSNRPTAYASSTQLNAAIPATDVVSGGPFAVTVFTPLPGGGTSSLLNLTLYARVGHDTNADLVLGQPNFTTNTFNNLAVPGASRLRSPNGLALDLRSGRLFVSDVGNYRVLSWPNASAQVNSQPADLVIGQPNLLASYTATVSARSLNTPEDLTVDGQGNLYVADFKNNRVLEYNAPLTSGMAASRVFGQADFTHNAANPVGINARSLNGPFGVAVDTHGNLYVADELNNRVLEYNAPLSSGMAASRVFGQGGSFTTGIANNGSVSANSLNIPTGLALDAQGNLYVVDFGNNRVLEFNTPLSSGTTADRVFGQPDFTSHAYGLDAGSLAGPLAAALDSFGNLYVDDGDNNRVLEYNAPLTSDRMADRVFGQPNFNSNTFNNGGVSAHSLNFPFSVALDAHNNLYVADEANYRVLEFDWARAQLALPLVIR